MPMLWQGPWPFTELFSSRPNIIKFQLIHVAHFPNKAEILVHYANGKRLSEMSGKVHFRIKYYDL